MGNEKGAWKGIVLGLTSSVVFALVVPWGTWATTQIYDLRQRLAEDKIMAEFVRSQLSELKEEQARKGKIIVTKIVLIVQQAPPLRIFFKKKN